jgi:hypothetical protein
MLTIESKTGIVNGSQERVFTYLSDFRNFSELMPQERLNDLEISRETIKFNLQGLGKLGLVIRDQKPFSELTIVATEESSAKFSLIIHIQEAGQDLSEVQLDLHADLNMFLEMMARTPLQQFADLLVDKISTVEFPRADTGC